jgi:AbrB family looped-hinge helix DNA binding protein
VSTLTVSSKGHIALPMTLRRRLGLGAGAQLEVFEEADGLRLRVLRPVAMSDLSELAGMVKAPSRGEARRLEDFDPASLTAREQPKPREMPTSLGSGSATCWAGGSTPPTDQHPVAARGWHRAASGVEQPEARLASEPTVGRILTWHSYQEVSRARH